MKNIERGVLKAIGGAIDKSGTISPSLLKKIHKDDLLLAGPSAAHLVFAPMEKLQKFRLIKILENDVPQGPSTILEKDGFIIRIFKTQLFEDHEIMPIKILKGTKEDLPKIYTLNLEQIILDFKNFKVYHSKSFSEFYETKQIKIINFISPKILLKKLKEIEGYHQVGHININHERNIALLFFFFHLKLRFSKNPELKFQLSQALMEISKKVDINILKKMTTTPQELFYLIRVALETSSKKSKRIFSILSQKRFNHLTGWSDNSIKEINTLFSKDISTKKLKDVGLLLYLDEVKTLASNYTQANLGLNDLINDLSYVFNKSYKDLNITQNTLKEYIKRFPKETLTKVKRSEVWTELNATEEVTTPIFPEGVTVKKLKTSNDLIKEGKRMKHCLGKMRKFSDSEERYFFSLHYKGEYSSLEIQRNVKGSTRESSPFDLLTEFERMLGDGPHSPARTERNESGYLEGIGPEKHYIFSIKGKCNKKVSLAHQQIAESLCRYLDQKRNQKIDNFSDKGNQDELNKKVA